MGEGLKLYVWLELNYVEFLFFFFKIEWKYTEKSAVTASGCRDDGQCFLNAFLLFPWCVCAAFMVKNNTSASREGLGGHGLPVPCGISSEGGKSSEITSSQHRGKGHHEARLLPPGPINGCPAPEHTPHSAHAGQTHVKPGPDDRN